MKLFFWCRRYVEIKGTFTLTVMSMLALVMFQMESGHAETTIIPSANVAGRYDTNIFNRPAVLLRDSQGNAPQLEDYVTTVGGAVQLLHETRDVETVFRVGGDFNAYLENTNLNFFNATLNGHIGLDRWVDQYVRGAKLRITENFRYTPESPAFVTGVRQLIPQDDAFFTGIAGFRANTFINTTAVTGSYPLSRDFSLEGGYRFGLRRVGRIIGGDTPGIGFFDTTTHTWHGGPRYQLTKNDSVAAVYRQSFILQSRSEGGRSFSTNLVTLAGDYTKIFQEWRFSAEAGITFVEPAGRSFPSGSLTITTAPERATVLHVTVLREARASIFLQGGAIINNRAQVGISHRIYERLLLEGTAAYGYNQFFPNTSDSTFQNFTGAARLSYNLTRNITGDVSYLYTNIDRSGGSVEYQFSRHVIGFFLNAEWK